MPDTDPDLPARLRMIEQALLDRVPQEKRAAVLRRILAALSPQDARALLADLERHPDAASWLQGLRDVA
jgi:hypothetical protein